MNKLGQAEGILLQSVEEEQIPVPRAEENSTGNNPMSLSSLGEMWPIIIFEM